MIIRTTVGNADSSSKKLPIADHQFSSQDIIKLKTSTDDCFLLDEGHHAYSAETEVME